MKIKDQNGNEVNVTSQSQGTINTVLGAMGTLAALGVGRGILGGGNRPPQDEGDRPVTRYELTSEDQRSFRWDAYVAANTFAHDLNGTNAYTNVDLLLKLSEKFWFEDEDFEDGNKIYWYHTSKKGFWR